MSECACVIETSDYEPAACFSETDRTERKAHVCCECSRTIEPGETYRHESGVWDGRPASYRTCVDCVSIRNTYTCGYIYGMLLVSLREYIEETDGQLGGLDKLTPAARERVIGLIQEQWDRLDMREPTRLAFRAYAKTSEGGNQSGPSRRHVFPWSSYAWLADREREQEAMDEAVHGARADALDRVWREERRGTA